MGVVTLWWVTVWPCRAKAAGQERGVPGVPRLLHPQGAACRSVGFWQSPFQLGKSWWCGFAGLSEEGSSWSIVPLPNLPAPFGKGTAGPSKALTGSRREAAPGTIPAKTWELLL